MLVYNAPQTNGAAAGFVLGQPNFTSDSANNGGLGPDGLNGARDVTVDSAGNVYVSDYLNNRVLAYLRPVALNDRTADFVFGQPDFYSNESNQGGVPSAGTLNNPEGLTTGPDGDLFIADGYNHRLMVYESPLNAADFSIFLPVTLK